MTTGPFGYESTLEIHLDAISLTSSVDDIRLINAESCRVSYHIMPLFLIRPLSFHWLPNISLFAPEITTAERRCFFFFSVAESVPSNLASSLIYFEACRSNLTASIA